MLTRYVGAFLADPTSFAQATWRRLRQRLSYYTNVDSQMSARRISPLTEGYDPADVFSAISDHMPLVLLERRAGFARAAVRAQDISVLLKVLSRLFPDVRPEIDGAHRTYRSTFAKDCLVAKQICFPINGARLAFDVFIEDIEGFYIRRIEDDEAAGYLHRDLFQRGQVTDLIAHLPELARPTDSIPVDVVYTWVNSEDAAWRDAFNNVEKGGVSADSTAVGRFYANDYLRYSLRSIALNMPWVGTIHIVSNCSPPDWLDITHPTIQWVPHETVMSAERLPTFNSHAIEAHLHLVPGLAEHFVYFNDDFFAYDTLSPRDFIDENGALIANLEARGMVNASIGPDTPDYLSAAQNGAALMFEKFGYYPARLHKHAPYSLTRSLLSGLAAEFAEQIETTRQAKFRRGTDISTCSFLAYHYGFMLRRVRYGSYETALLKSNDPLSIAKLAAFGPGAPHPKVVCVNECGVPAPTERWRQQIAALLAEHFPQRAPWERNR